LPVISTGTSRALARSNWSIGGLAAAGVFVAVSSAEAATSMFWPDYDPGIMRELPPVQKRKPKSPRRPDAKLQKMEKQAAKPQGPLVIAISLEQQSLKVYDANGVFAETAISTGMRGHPTPTGVFSVIQKNKYHRSNIYSGAPMPYMQRITWSGIALHAGALPGYPASHGCIRLPMNFATRLWGWTRMGARVIVTPGEISPGSFSHPLLFAKRPDPATPVAALPASETTGKSDKATTDGTPVASAIAERPELRPSLMADGGTPAAKDAGPANRREQVRTADAGSTLPGAAIASDVGRGEPIVAPKPTGSESAVTGSVTPPPSAAESDAATDAPAKDQARASQGDSPAPGAAAPATLKRSGHIAVLISRKDSKLYVRQNFTPVFDVPIGIAPSDRPLGTHVFTAAVDKEDANSFRWSVVTLPSAKHQVAQDGDDRVTRRRKAAGAVEMASNPLPNSAAEALDRLSIPADALERIAEVMSTGGSIIVSDQGVASAETGLGTDFILPLR
jgi:hypothetical protein